MEYILTCHIQSVLIFCIFFQEFYKIGVKLDNSFFKWNISQLVIWNLYPIFHYFQRRTIHLIKRIYPNMPNEFFNEFWKWAKLCPFILKLESIITQDIPDFSVFNLIFYFYFNEFHKNGVSYKNSYRKWNISLVVISNLYPDFCFQCILEKQDKFCKFIHK